MENKAKKIADEALRKHKVKKLMEEMDKERGFRRLWRDLLAERDPEFMELTHKTISHVFRDGALPAKFKEIICICVDALQFYEPGVRIHTRRALNMGVTEQEIIEALEVAIMPGHHPLNVHLPAIVEEVGNYKKGIVKDDLYADK